MAARRGRPEGSIYFDRAKQRWIGLLSLGTDDQGRRVRRKVVGRAKTEVRERLAEKRHTAKRTGGQVPRGDLTVADLVRELLRNPPAEWASPITRGQNTAICNRIIERLGTVRAERLSIGQVTAFLSGLIAEVYAASTVRRHKGLQARALYIGEDRHGLVRNVARQARTPKMPGRPARKAMTEAQQQQLLGSGLDPYWRAWIQVALDFGLRPGETGSLRWDDVVLQHDDYPDGVLFVRHGFETVERPDGRRRVIVGDLKNEHSARAHALTAEARAVLLAWRAEQERQRAAAGALWHGTGLVFTDPYGRPRRYNWTVRHFARVCERAGLPGRWAPYECRHSAATTAELYVTRAENAYALGHSGLDSIKSYEHNVIPVHTVARRVSEARQARNGGAA